VRRPFTDTDSYRNRYGDSNSNADRNGNSNTDVYTWFDRTDPGRRF
jgi:hypothetical protein